MDTFVLEDVFEAVLHRRLQKLVPHTLGLFKHLAVYAEYLAVYAEYRQSIVADAVSRNYTQHEHASWLSQHHVSEPVESSKYMISITNLVSYVLIHILSSTLTSSYVCRHCRDAAIFICEAQSRRQISQNRHQKTVSSITEIPCRSKNPTETGQLIGYQSSISQAASTSLTFTNV